MAGDTGAIHRYEAVKTLFLQNSEAPAYLDALSAGRPYAWGRPQPEDRTAPTAGLYADGSNVVIWNRDGEGHAFINEQWSGVLRSELHRQVNPDGTVDLHRSAPDHAELLLHVDPSRRDHSHGRGESSLPSERSSVLDGHVRDPLPEQAHRAVERLEAGLGRTFDESSSRLVASTACLAKEAGLTRIDHVVLSEQTITDKAGVRIFVVQGDLADPAHVRAQMPTSQAVASPVDDSLARLLAVEEDRQRSKAAPAMDDAGLRADAIGPQSKMV